MEKEHQPDSMATITMKPEYPPSEVYSTSEPPPAYRQRPSSSVQIARIAALTVVAASFIIGSFILASSWVAARASCHQLEQLDAMLDKEFAHEGRAYGNDALLADEPLPNAHALLGAAPPMVHSALPEQEPSPAAPSPVSQTKEHALHQAESKLNEDKLQKIDDVANETPNSSDESSDSDSSAEEEDDVDSLRPMIKLPIQFDLDELAGAFLASSQKGHMNCMVERRREDPMERRLPFNIFGSFAPRKQHAERIAIICHGGDKPRQMDFPESQSQVFAFPLSGPVRLPLKPQPPMAAAQDPRMAAFAPPPPPTQHRPESFLMPMPWDSSEEQVGAPREMRIHVQRVIAIPAAGAPQHNMPPPPEMMGNAGHFAPPPPPPQQRNQNEIQKIQMDGTPVQMQLPWGLTPEELHEIHRTAEDAAAAAQLHEQQMDGEVQDVRVQESNMPWGMTPERLQVIHRTLVDAAAQPTREQQMDTEMQEVKTIVNTLAAAAEAEAQAQAQAEVQERQAEAPQGPTQNAPAQAQRVPRTLLLPLDMPMEERPHYMHPRSVRSVDNLLQSPKRVKRCACSCA